MDVTILIDPKVSIETRGFATLVSWSLNEYDPYIDFDKIGFLLTGFARIFRYKCNYVKNVMTRIKMISFEEGFVKGG